MRERASGPGQRLQERGRSRRWIALAFLGATALAVSAVRAASQGYSYGYDPTGLTPEQEEAIRERIQKDIQRREAEAAWELLDQIKQEFDALFDYWDSLKDSYAAAAIAAAPRPAFAGIRVASNSYGARFSVPHGRYRGDGLLGVLEVTIHQGDTERLAVRQLTRGQQGLRQIGHGWSFEPGAMLKEYYTIISTEPGVRPTCRAVKRFSYVSAEESTLFQNRGVEQACSFQLEPDQSPVECEAAAASFCDASQPTQFWSTHGQVALDVSSPASPVIRFPDGRSEVMGAGGSHLPFNEGLFDNMGNQGVNIRPLTFTKKRLDRNGNVTRYVYSNGFVDKVVDPRGRETRYVRDPDTGRVLEVHAPGPGGAEHVWSMTWTSFNWSPSQVFADFPCVADDAPFTCPDLSYTTLTRLRVPDGREFTFAYEPWGALRTAVAPGGMTTEFRYGTAGTPTHPPVRFSQTPQFIDRVDQRRLAETIVTVLGDPGGPRRTTIEHEAAVTLTENASRDCLLLRWIKQTQPDGTVARQGLCSRNDNNTLDTTFEATNGRVMAQEVRDGAGRLVEGTYFGNPGMPAAPGHVGNMYVAWETADAPNTNEHAKGDVLDVRQTKVFHVRDGVTWTEEIDYSESNIPANESCPGCPTFRTWGNQIARRVLNGAGTPLVETRTTFFHPGAYRARNLLRLPATVELVDLQTGQVLGRRESRYDETALVPSGSPNLEDVGSARGDNTSVLAHRLTEAGAVTIRSRFYDTGDVFESTDANGNTTTTNLDFRLCADTPTLTGSVINALGHTATTLTDCSSALVLRVTDANGQRTCTKYDFLGRAVEVAGPGDALTSGGIAAAGCDGSQGPTATTEYFLFGREVSDIAAQRTVVRAKDGSADGHYVKTSLDGQGRTVQTRAEVDPATSAGFAEVVSTTEYDRMGRVAKVHVPCFQAARDVKNDCENPKFTATTYDALGRVVSVTPPGLPPTTTDYGSEAGDWTTLVTPVQDATRQKRTRTNVLGHTIETAAKWSDCGGCWLSTTMTYDAAGRLLSAADPGGNPMSMTYDGLGRKRSLTDPDMGGFAGRSWTYDYDDNGNLISQTDAKGQNIRICYDALNRITLKDLPPVSGSCDRATAGPEDVTYFYDGDLPAPPPICSFTINPTSASVPSQGGSGSVSVTVGPTCDWTAAGNVPWMTVTPTSGRGSGTVVFTVAANPDSTPRTGTATIAGQTFTVNQDGDVVCSVSVSPPSQSFPVGGGTGTIQVTAPASCSWTATAGAGWITITGGGSGSGAGTVTYSVASNSGPSRSSTITVGGQAVNISQAGGACGVVLNPTISFPPGTPATTGSFAVTAPAGCGWTAVSRESWVTVTGGASGSGDGTVSYSVAVNPSGVTRLGRIDVSDQVFTVEQGPNSTCGATVNPANPVIAASAGTHSVSLTINAGCTWRVLNEETPWITLLLPTEGTGPASISYSVTANTGTKSRQGVFLVGEAIVSVTQLAPCSASIAPSSQSFPSGAGSASVAVTIPAGCSWTASSPVGWVTITGGASGIGNGTVSYSVAANPGTSSRSVQLTIAGLSFTVSQAAAAPCAPGSYSIAPLAQNFPNSGGTGSVSVTAPAGCPWTAGSNVSWVTITSASSGSGNGTVTFSVGVNPQSDNTPPPPRSGTLTIAGQTFTVNQGVTCGYTVSPTSASVPSGGGPGSVSVTAPAGCSWTASSGASWITVTSAGSGSGNGSVTYSVAANPGAARTGTIAVAGQTVTISQAGTCAASFAISPTTASVGSSGGSGTVSVSAGAGCAWTAVSGVAWITITGGASGTGSGTVSYTVAANPGASSRTGTVAIANQVFAVTQAGSCAFTLSATGASFGSGGGTGSVGVTASAGCSWTAVSGAAWITVTGGSSGTGSGTVTYSVAANGGTGSRTGTVTIAGQTFTVTQAGAATCTFSLSPTSASFEVSGGQATFNVNTGAGCTWTASRNVGWITIDSGNGCPTGTRTGPGTVCYTVYYNEDGVSRTGQIAVGGQTLTVTQGP